MNVFDVAAFILKRQGRMTTWKLQKLVYYSQAWSLVWDERPLFAERIEAWANGPVCPALYECHRGMFYIDHVAGDPSCLDHDAQGTVEGVLNYYGPMTGQYLSDLTHMEAPWRTARGELPDGVRSGRVITLEAMAEYYGSLPPDEEDESETG